MVVRTKVVVRIIAISIVVINMLYLSEKLIRHDSLTLRDGLALLLFPLLSYLFLFVLPTMRITFSERDISVYWKFGLGSIKLWEQTNYHLKWQDLTKVYSLFPTWIPIHAIGIVGFQGKKMRSFYIGALTTKKKESLVYIGDHVKANIVEKDVQKLIDKYRT